MRVLFILLALVLLGSCEKGGSGFVDSEVAPYVAEFETALNVVLPHDATVEIVDNLKFGNFRLKGYAHGLNESFVYVQIDREYWDDMDDMARRLLVFHELGHDVLNLHHTDKRIDVGGPHDSPSLMNTGYPAWALGGDYSYGNRQAVLDQFVAEHKRD